MANEARLLIRADDKASKVLRDVSGEAEKAAKPLSDIGKIAAGFVVGQGLMKLPGLFSSTVSAASDLAEAGSKVNVVFGPDAVEVTQFAKLADNIGLSDAAALSATGTFGNLFVSMGMPTKEAATMSMEIVELAADLASFNNIEIADALQKLQAGLVGETEPLRALGVNLSAAAIEAKAMELGLADAEGALTAADKATASYKLILEQTQTAQGDFERTSDGLANKQRMLKADIADLQAEIGQKLVPAMGAGVDIMGKMVAAADDLPLGTLAIAGMGVAAMTAAPHVARMGSGIADLVADIRKGDRPLNTFGTRLGALTVGLVAADLASQAFTGRSLTERVIGDVAKSEAAEAALAALDAKLLALGPNADRAAAATDLLWETNAKLGSGAVTAEKEVGGFMNVLTGSDGRIFGFNVGASEAVDNMKDMEEAVRLAGRELRANDAPLQDMIAAYQQLNPELRDAFDDATHVTEAWVEATGGLTGLANVLPEVAEAYAAMKPAQDASATATEHWSDSIDDAAKKAKALDDAIAALNGRFAELDPIYQALQSKAALYNEELDDLKAKGDDATESDKARIGTLEGLIQSIEGQTTAMESNKAAVEAQQTVLEKLMGPQGYEAFQRKLSETKLSLEEQTDVTGRVADAYGDLALNDIPTAMRKFDELKGSLAPEVWQPIAQGLGPKLVEAIRMGVADPGEQAKLYQEVWNMMTAGLGAAEKAALGATEIGRQIVNGIASGIRENSYLLVEAAATAAQIPMTEFAAALEIKSPSKVMADKVGKPIIQGITAGMMEELPNLLAAVGQVTNAIVETAVATTQGATPWGHNSFNPNLPFGVTAEEAEKWRLAANGGKNPDNLVIHGQAALGKTPFMGEEIAEGTFDPSGAGGRGMWYWDGAWHMDPPPGTPNAMYGSGQITAYNAGSNGMVPFGSFDGEGFAFTKEQMDLLGNPEGREFMSYVGANLSALAQQGYGGTFYPGDVHDLLAFRAGGIVPYGATGGNGNIRQLLSGRGGDRGGGGGQTLIINTIDARSFRDWLNAGGGEEIAAYFNGRKVFV